jgi:hypothetical protein
MTDIPSSADYYGPVGPSSASPSSWSLASSDTAPSSASSVIESKVRFERLPNGGHRHHLSAPKRQQFLANQVRRLRELLDGRRDRDDHLFNPPPPHQQAHGQHQLKPEVFEHPLSLLNEKYQDLETDPTGSPASSHRRRHSVKTDFLHKYGELQQIIGKGNYKFRFWQSSQRIYEKKIMIWDIRFRVPTLGHPNSLAVLTLQKLHAVRHSSAYANFALDRTNRFFSFHFFYW